MKPRICFFLITCIITLNVSGQTYFEMLKIDVDSIQNTLPDLRGTSKVDALNKLAFGLSPHHADSSFLLAQQATLLAADLDYPKGVADAHFCIGLTYLFLDNLKQSILNFLDALHIYEELGPSMEMGFTLEHLSAINFMTNRYKMSNEYARKAVQVYNDLGKTLYEARMTYSLALTHTENLEFDSATYYNLKALSLLKGRQDTLAIKFKASVCLDQGYNLGHKIAVTGNKESREESIRWYLRGLRHSEKVNDSMLIALCVSNLGFAYSAYESEDSLQKGIKYTLREKKIASNLKIRAHLILHAHHRLAQIEYKKGNVAEAISLVNKGLEETVHRMQNFSAKDYPSAAIIIWDRHYYLVELSRAYNFLHTIYTDLGDYKKALEYYILEQKIKSKLEQNENRNLIAMLEAESENEKTENQISMLERNREISELKATQSRNLNIGIGVLFLILLSVGLLFIRQMKMANEHKSTLLEQKLLRLQMNPHFIFNAFSNILKFIDNNENSKASNYLTTFSKLLRTTLESTREDLVPFERERGTLENYLELQKLRYPNKFSYAIEIDQAIDEEEMSIPPMLVQPFIENSIEHGIRHKKGKGHIDVRFILDGKKIVCEVEDDGIGRKKAWEAEVSERSDRKPLATNIVQDRINVLNRKFKQKISLDIIDKPVGTLVRLDLPYLYII